MKNTARWTQLVAGIVCMVAVANLQYGWTLFVDPINAQFHFGRAAIQVAFTIFVLAQTWLAPIEGYLVDRFGPRVVVLVAGLLAGTAWTVNSFATSLPMFYFAAALAGISAGVIVITATGNALRWFPDRRGLAVGLTSAGFGMGAIVTIIPLAHTIATSGYQSAFLWFGLAQGIVVVVASLLLKAPVQKEIMTPGATEETGHKPWRMVHTAPFWVMYVMFVAVATGGLMATAQLALVAKDFGVATIPVNLLFLTLPALSFALALNQAANGLSRPFFGWISDRIGREKTMFIAFLAEASGILLLFTFGHHPLLFVLFSGIVFFSWGEIYSLFPALCTDIFGKKFATANYGLLYTAKGVAALLIPLGNVLVASTGTWKSVFIVAISLDISAAFLALFVLLPLRRTFVHTTR